jgi:alginate O-acetyltransferase complex protein AlgI
MGLNFGRNFNRPYFATDFSDFWRRWHISLSSWLRDYLYIPLGGNRDGTFKTYRNLIVYDVSGWFVARR